MMRRFLLVGVFVVIQPGSIQQLAYATFVTLLYLAVQLMAAPFKSLSDDFMAAMSSLALSMLFVLCLLYKFGVLTQLHDVQEVISLELHDDYVVPYVTFSGILWSVCMSTFVTLGLIFAKSAGDEALNRARTRRLLYKSSNEEVRPSTDFVQSAKRLHEMIDGSQLYRKNSHGRVVEAAAPFPTAGPFHLFLSHSGSHSDLNTAFIPIVVYFVLTSRFPLARLEARTSQDAHHQESPTREAAWHLSVPRVRSTGSLNPHVLSNLSLLSFNRR